MEKLPKNMYGFLGDFADNNTDYKAYDNIA